MTTAANIPRDAEQRMQGAYENTAHELAKLRTGRATLALLDPVQVECYGGKMSVRQLANCTLPDGRTIIIQPFDKTILGDIEKAIQKSDLGLTPSNDGKVIRLNIPSLSEERRRELVKVAKRIVEEGRVAVRNVRRDANETVKKEEKAGAITEDDSRRLQDEIQKITDGFIKKLDELLSGKEQEIMSF